MDNINLTNSEWYVLDCLWERAPMTVMELVGALGDRLGWAKSTTITTLRRMEDKGLVLCSLEGRTKHYTPAVRRENAVRGETRFFRDKVYRGSVGLMMSAMVESRRLSESDIAELSAILDKAGGDDT